MNTECWQFRNSRNVPASSNFPSDRYNAERNHKIIQTVEKIKLARHPQAQCNSCSQQGSIHQCFKTEAKDPGEVPLQLLDHLVPI